MQFASSCRRVASSLPTILLLLAAVAGGLASRALAPAPAFATTTGVADEMLLAGVFATIPPDVSWVGIDRVTLAPGAVREVGKTESEGVGPRLFRVESGEMTIDADGPLAVWRAGARKAGVVGANTTTTLRPGDRGSTPAVVGSVWRNAAGQPSTLIEVAITARTDMAEPAGVADAILAGNCSSHPLAIPNQPVAIGLRRVTLAAGASLPAARISGLIAFAVDGGALTIDDPGVAPGSTAGSFTIRRGDGRTFGGFGYRDVPAGWVFRNAATEPASVLLLTLTPADPLMLARI